MILISALAAFAGLGFSATTASAASISVVASYGFADICVPAPAQLSYRLTFSAKVKASGIAKPSKIRIGFQINDAVTKRVLRSGVTNLHRSKGYKGGKTPRFTVDADQLLTYHLNMSYKAGGRTLKKKASFDDVVPSADQIERSGLPGC